MPKSGEKNTSFGIYKSVCCGRTTVMISSEMFPECPNHRHSLTEWIAVSDSDEIISLDDTLQKSPF